MNFGQEMWVYKVTYDALAAPCVRDNVLSLAICKPPIRNNANKGDIIAGLSGREMEGEMGRLIYFAEVEEIITGDRYYTEAQYADRLDCVYRDCQGKAVHKGVGYPNHGDTPIECKKHLRRDIGRSGLIKDARILLSRDFVYLGKEGTDGYSHFPPLKFLKAYGLGQCRLLKRPGLSESEIAEAYLLFADYLTQIYKQKGKGYTGTPTLKEDWEGYLAAQQSA